MNEPITATAGPAAEPFPLRQLSIRNLAGLWQWLTPDERNQVEEIFRNQAIAGTRTLFPPPQPGPQTEYDTSEADIVVYGGAAGGGKTFALLRDAGQYVAVPGYRAVIFRRTSKQITNAGGLWDESKKWYPATGGEAKVGPPAKWTWESDAEITFSHMELEANKEDWQGSQIAFIGFDELTHFTEGQFFYLLSRNRSLCGIRPKVRATTNPAPGWVKTFLAPWLDKEYPDPAKSGEVRYFVRVNGKVQWVEKHHRLPRTELGDISGLSEDAVEEMRRPKSVTFIRSRVYDNKILLQQNPHYLVNLKSLPLIEQARLLNGDWDIFEGSFFAEFSPYRHTCPPATDVHGRPVDLSRLGWHFYGGLDWGFDKPFAFVLRAVDPYGTRHVIQSIKKAGLTNEQQAAEVCTILNRWGVPREKCKICADKSMWSQRTVNAVKVEADIAAFKRAGLRLVKSGGLRMHGWNAMRKWLHAVGAELDTRRPAYVIWEGYNDDLIRQFPEWQYKKGTEDLDTDSDDHLADAHRYSEDADPGIPGKRKPKTKNSQDHLPFALRTNEKTTRKE